MANAKPMRVHVLQHVAFEGLGCIHDWLQRKQAAVTFTRFYEACVLPDVADIDFVIALGGPMSVNDEAKFPWLSREKQFIADAMRANKLVLGICLGAQLIANALGARVYPNREREIGWFPVYSLHKRGNSLKLPGSFEAFHWHGETFDLTPGANLLASSAACKNQIFQIGSRVVGLQFHLETDPQSVAALLANGRHELKHGPFVQNEAKLRRTPAINYRMANTLMRHLLEQFAAPANALAPATTHHRHRRLAASGP
ncbi:type 1 glutamine amidotransferase [Methylomonas koyamae]|uniref:type 1 glutamine amidotransferase n=1 Tax=Methylomonas koyamae TaxID=702114 RepID=UPI001E4870ED|nr:type 1 glutamine amidotransferase [Methylomonas koyamae]